MPDLRTAWASLTRDQRNALVAEAMGWRLVQPTGAPFSLLLSPGAPLPEGWTCSPWAEYRPHTSIPDFCGSWPGCGLIWEECERRELDICISRYPRSTDENPVPTVVSIVRGADLWEGDCSDARESLAMAFCLASGISVPEEWTEGGDRG